jgi:hypothetical protein
MHGQFRNGDKIIYTLKRGKMVKVAEPRLPLKDNFVIVCDYGDWSGFRTLAECEAQFAELESKGRPDYFYSVVER